MVGEPATYVQVLRTKGRRDRLARFSNSPITKVDEANAYGGAPWATLQGSLRMADASQIAADKNKEAAGGVSCMLWIITGIYYFATTPQAHFISWQSLVFFVGGAFASAFVIGAAIYYAMEATRTFIYRPHFKLTARNVVGAIVNLALNILQFIAPVFLARWSFQLLYPIT